MECKLVVTKKETHIITAVLEDGGITELLPEPSKNSFLGNIYVGKVKNIVKNIGAAFVEFEKGQMGYLPLEKAGRPIHTDTVKRGDDRILIGDELLVQVVREAVKTKPPTLSVNLDFSGKYLVLGTGRSGIHVSKKITEKAERERLKEMLEPYASDEYALIARTGSKAAKKETMEREILFLRKRYETLIRTGKHKTVFSKLYEEAPLYLETIKNRTADGKITVETDIPELYEQISGYIRENQWEEAAALSLWDEEHGKLSAVCHLDRTLERALRKKVWLKSGGYLIIEPTEALVSIDVNTGKAVGKKKDVQKHFLKINKEAAVEIALQLKLRNLSGIILVDFIDLEEAAAKEELLSCFRAELKKDPVPVQLVDMTKLGLVELTRKKTRKPLYEELSENVRIEEEEQEETAG
ncbi:MAG: ribonuclease E/G [Lachnospiraceae bacterium]|nr:ribonuclease E/G [Lachnospiraceae bacterium]